MAKHPSKFHTTSLAGSSSGGPVEQAAFEADERRQAHDEDETDGAAKVTSPVVASSHDKASGDAVAVDGARVAPVPEQTPAQVLSQVPLRQDTHPVSASPGQFTVAATGEILHNGKRYRPGDAIPLTEAEADALGDAITRA